MLKTNIISLVFLFVLFTGCENQDSPTKQMNTLLDAAPPVFVVAGILAFGSSLFSVYL